MSNEVINPYQTFRDDNGNVLANGTVGFYINTTATLDTIFSDEALTVSQTNPYPLDAYGRIAGDVKYSGKKTLTIRTESGGFVRTIDNVSTMLSSVRTVIPHDTLAAAVADRQLVDGDTLIIKDRGNATFHAVLSSDVTENLFNVIQCTGVETLSLNLDLSNGILSNQWGVYANRTTDFTTVIQAMFDYAIPLGLNIDITDACLVTTLYIDKVVDGNTASATVPGDAVVDVNNNDTFFKIGGEGRLLKSGTGNMFDTNLTNTDANAPVVQMVEIAVDIEHTDPSLAAYLISPKYLRTKFTGKTIDGMKFVKSTTILSQSIYLEGPVNIRRVQGKFWDNDYFNYDIQSHVLMEASADGFWMKNTIGCAISGTIEGLSGTAIAYDGAEGLDIRCYFEQNYLDVDGTYGGTSSSVAYGVNLHGSYLAKSPFTPTAATQANPVVMTSVAHGRLNGDKIWVVSVGGMTELNGRVFTVANKTDDTIELSGVDGTGYTAFTVDGLGRCHPFTVKWGQTSNSCISTGNRHTGAMHDITDTSVNGLVTYDVAAERLANIDYVDIVNAGYSGTYTGTLTGCTTSPTATIRYEKTGNTVTLYIPSLTATSNSTGATITGAPSQLSPARQQLVISRIKDNSIDEFGSTLVNTDAVLHLGTGAASGAFTASGTKGTEVHTITYSLT